MQTAEVGSETADFSTKLPKMLDAWDDDAPTGEEDAMLLWLLLNGGGLMVEAGRKTDGDGDLGGSAGERW